MAYIVSYRRVSTPYTIINLVEPTGPDDARVCTELCTLDGVTYVSIPDGHDLPPQPPEITVERVELTPGLRERIKAASSHCELIQRLMQEKIRALYPLEEEMYYARVGVGVALGMYEPEPGELNELTVFGEHVESVREWGRSERAKLGL